MAPIQKGEDALRRLFAALTENTFQVDLGVADPPLIDYLVELLLRFVRMEAIIKIRDAEGRRLEDVAAMLVEAEERLEKPRREIYRHIGDFTLFWAGVYPEALKRLQSEDRRDHLLDYFEQGKRSYLIASTYDEADVICTHGTTVMDQPADKPIVNINHGLYWSIHDWPHWAHHANSQVVEAMMRAQFHTAPSNWVANALRRGMMVYPEVVHHGIDADEWTPVDDHHDFVLWNKARADAVSDPQDMVELARRLPGVRFVSTIGGVGKPSNVEEIGVMTVHQI
ncbi:MAG: hypothetical protein IID45_14065, partial [Planctomycetes bacterium]|nr:hypothetical protein [Planctomycetota bacterium]